MRDVYQQHQRVIDPMPGVAGMQLGRVVLQVDPRQPALRRAQYAVLFVVPRGTVLDQDGSDAGVEGARAAFSFIGGNARLDGTAIQTVGAKGYDGFAIAIVG